MSFPTTGILSTFTGAAESPLSEGGNWSLLENLNLRRTNVNTCNGQNFTQLSASYWTVSTYGPDSEAYVKVATLSGVTADYIRLYLRVVSPGSSYNGYMMQWSRDANGCRIFRATSGSITQIAQAAAATYALNDVLGFEAIGSTLTVYKNGSSVLSTTDATYSAAGYLALGVRDSNHQLDDFGGGTVVTASSRPKSIAMTGVG